MPFTRSNWQNAIMNLEQETRAEGLQIVSKGRTKTGGFKWKTGAPATKPEMNWWEVG
jgi:hypothetical protein